MATSPAPDAAAPPGMCPGVAVLGGGGAGGDRDGDGSGAKDGSGGNGNGNGENGNGDAKGGDGCGAGSGGGCPNPQHGNGGKLSAGDPVDVLTGRVYTAPIVDLALPGPLPLVIERIYSSAAIGRDVGLGPGWAHSLAWEIEERRKTLRIWTPRGAVYEIETPAAGTSVRTGLGVLTRHEWGYSLAENGRITRVFQATGEGQRLPMSLILDRNGNTIELRYSSGALQTIVDSARRIVRVRRHEDGRIAAFEVKSAAHQGKWRLFREYGYDACGDLISATDAAGQAVTLEYVDHLLTSMTYPEGLRVSYRYDCQARCIETWAEYPGRKDESLADDVPALLADGTTRAKGVFHCTLLFGSKGYVEVADSRAVRRYFGDGLGRVEKAVLGGGVHTSTFDLFGNLTSYTDPYDSTSVWARDEAGRVLRSCGPLGAETKYTYDIMGQLIEVTDPLGHRVWYCYDERGNLASVADELGEVVSYKFDARGLLVGARLPDGGITRIQYDELGGVASVHEPDGSSRDIRRDYLGQVIAFKDERGLETRYVYGERRELVAIHLPGGRTISYQYDRDGRFAGVTNADGHRWELRWSGLGAVHELRKPDGTRVRYRYDREGDLVQILNERGEVHHLRRDPTGRIVGEETFDGRYVRYRVDQLGRIVRLENGARETTEFVYDAAGRTVARVYADDTSDTFEYDSLDRLVVADNGRVRCTYAYDVRGNLVRETQTIDSVTSTLDVRYDVMDRRMEKRSSHGYVEGVAYDLLGRPAQIALGGSELIRLRRDASGHELERVLPDGGAIQNLIDSAGLVAHRRVISPVSSPSVPAGEPAWVGPAPQDVTCDQAFRYSPAGHLIESWDRGMGRTLFTYDPLGQVLAKLPERARAEAFQYDEAGNLYEAGESAKTRSYERGGRLVRRGAMTYAYDGDGRLIAKQRPAEDGSGLATRYYWNARGLLDAIEAPTGERLEFVYDPFARRIQKRVTAPDGEISTTRFMWDGEHLLHDLRSRAAASGDAIVEERTYSFLPDTFVPLAHRDSVITGEERSTGEWVHYVTDTSDRPELLVSGSGEVLARLDGGVWGERHLSEAPRVDTPLRFPGQYEDAETGLCYNHFRYYDPELGRYLSPDPIGLEGGLRLFGYADNRPISVVDPDGLVPVTTTVTSDQEDKYGKRHSQSAKSGSASTGSAGRIHPVVQQSLVPKGEGYPGTNNPESCGEPRALSRHIEKWERKIGRKLDPNNPKDHDEIKKCLGSITAIRAEEPDGTKRAPCANCSQLLANLHEKWGAPKPSAIRKGFGASGKRGDTPINFTPPRPEWKPPAGYKVQTGYGG